METNAEVRIARILHPTDFSRASEIAFGHALKIALAMRAKLDVVHVSEDALENSADEFPEVTETLERWCLVTPSGSTVDLSDFGIGIRKKTVRDADPLQGILHHLNYANADLVVLATHRDTIDIPYLT